jgi:uncharacterized membrane protein
MTTIFISRNREQLGQFTEQEVRSGLVTGQFLGTDLAWKEGMAEWQLLSSFNLVPAGNLSSLQKAGGAQLLTHQAPTGKVDIGECFSKAWEAYKSNFGPCLAAIVIVMVISIAVQTPMSVIQAIFDLQSGQATEIGMFQIVGGLAFLLIWVVSTSVSMILTAGMMYFYISVLRGQPGLGILFSGFRGSHWWKILVAGSLWTAALLLGVGILAVPVVLLSTSMNMPSLIFVGGAIAIIPIIYFSVAMAYALPLIIDQNLGPLEALMTSLRVIHTQWWQVFGLILLLFLLSLGGVLLCCIGMLFTLPLAYLILGEGYRQLFGDPAAQA